MKRKCVAGVLPETVNVRGGSMACGGFGGLPIQGTAPVFSAHYTRPFVRVYELIGNRVKVKKRKNQNYIRGNISVIFRLSD
jgi:hypothetical protein